MAHIPSGTTQELELVTFRQALEAADTPSDEYDIKKWIYAPNFYSEYRYILGTRGCKPLICIGINPSTAKPDALDNTLKSVERIALGNGFDSFIMFNVYAQRATSPDDMEKVCNPLLHKENLMCCLFRSIRWCGRPGARSLKSVNTCPTACGTCCWQGRRMEPSGAAPVPFPGRDTPITRCICGRTRSFGRST